MNILYCGDKNIIDGMIISILSLLKNTKEQLNIICFTMRYENEEKIFDPFPQEYIDKLDKLVKEVNKNSSVKLYDITDLVNEMPPTANINTRFTPYCMLRLYADLVPDIPSKVLYLDNDVVCLKDPSLLYDMDISKYEIAGALDHWGQFIYHRKPTANDYINSGVLLMNMDLIKKNRLFEKCRKLCNKIKMLLPDQHAINLYTKKKKIIPSIYNNQVKISKKTVFRHFTTTFKFVPKPHTQTIKPWNIEQLHNVLKTYEIDDILEEYKKVKEDLK